MSKAEFQVHDDILEMFGPEVVTGEDVERMLGMLSRLRERHPRPFLLVQNGGPTLSTAARKAVVEWSRASDVPLEGATYGGGMVQRVVIDMLRRAVDLLAPGRLVLASCKTREEALAWIEQRRRTPTPDCRPVDPDMRAV